MMATKRAAAAKEDDEGGAPVLPVDESHHKKHLHDHGHSHDHGAHGHSHAHDGTGLSWLVSSKTAQLAFVVSGIYGSFLTWGVLQERVTTKHYVNANGDEEIFDEFVVLSLLQSLCATILAYFFVVARGQKVALAMFDPVYFQIALTASVGAYSGYRALEFVTFPFVVLLKSSKLLPVMATNMVLYGKRYQWYQYLSVALITGGVSMFMLVKPSKGEGVSSNSLIGVALVLFNLFLDGFTNSTEEEIRDHKKVSAGQLMFFYNFAQVILVLAFLLTPATSQLYDAIVFLTNHPQALQDILLFVFCNATGQLFIFLTIELFDSLTLVTITVTRKLFTILMSVVIYGHNILPLQWLSVAVVFTGIALESFFKDHSKKSGKKHH